MTIHKILTIIDNDAATARYSDLLDCIDIVMDIRDNAPACHADLYQFAISKLWDFAATRRDATTGARGKYDNGTHA